MATDDSFADVQQDQNRQRPTLAAARADLAETLAGAGHQLPGAEPDGDEQLVKPGNAGYTLELRLNGATIALGGQDVTQLSRGDFQAFVDQETPKVEAGDYDAEIEAALAQDGPGKALARVRAVDRSA